MELAGKLYIRFIASSFKEKGINFKLTMSIGTLGEHIMEQTSSNSCKKRQASSISINVKHMGILGLKFEINIF